MGLLLLEGAASALDSVDFGVQLLSFGRRGSRKPPKPHRHVLPSRVRSYATIYHLTHCHSLHLTKSSRDCRFAMLYVVGESLPRPDFLTKVDQIITLSTSFLAFQAIAFSGLAHIHEEQGADEAKKWNDIIAVGSITVYIAVRTSCLRCDDVCHCNGSILCGCRSIAGCSHGRFSLNTVTSRSSATTAAQPIPNTLTTRWCVTVARSMMFIAVMPLNLWRRRLTRDPPPSNARRTRRCRLCKPELNFSPSKSSTQKNTKNTRVRPRRCLTS
jgi:hypothetical protein